jgi:predicted DNA-binding ribbon-helix-helix protein
MQKSQVFKRSIVIGGRKTSVSLEDAFWDALREIATARGVPTATLVSTIDTGRAQSNLSSAIRLFVLDHYRAQGDNRAEPNTTYETGGQSKHSLAVGSGGTFAAGRFVGIAHTVPL